MNGHYVNSYVNSSTTLSTSAPYAGRAPAWQQSRVTQGQLDAVALRCRQVLDESMQRVGSCAVAALNEGVLTLRVEHSLAAAEHQVMRRATGRQLFQHYVEELAEQVYPEFAQQIENILPYAVTYARVKVDCDGDCIVFSFGLRSRVS